MVHTAILNLNLWWLDWDECVGGIHPYAPFADALYAFKGRGFGGEAGLDSHPSRQYRHAYEAKTAVAICLFELSLP